MLTTGESYSGSAWPAYETCLSRRTVVASPTAQAAMWRSVAHQCNAPSSLPIPNSNSSPTLSSGPPGTRGLRIALGRRISHVSLRGSILVFRVAGVPVRRRPNTGQVTFWGALLLQRRFASLQQTWLEMVACSTERRRSEVGARSCPVCMRACVRARMGGLSGDRLLFIHHVSLIWSDAGSEHSVLCGELGTAAFPH